MRASVCWCQVEGACGMIVARGWCFILYVYGMLVPTGTVSISSRYGFPTAKSYSSLGVRVPYAKA